MYSTDESFLGTPGIRIYNNRNESDLSLVVDNLFSGME